MFSTKVSANLSLHNVAMGWQICPTFTTKVSVNLSLHYVAILVKHVSYYINLCKKIEFNLLQFKET